MASDHEPIRFSMKGMLLLLTAACGLLGLVQWALPDEISTRARVSVSVLMLFVLASAVWIYLRRRQNPWRGTDDFVVVKVDAKWLRRIKSPYVMGPVAALTGVSISFAPAYLFWCGPIGELNAWEWLGVAASFLTIYLVPGFYMRLAAEVMAEMLREEGERKEKPRG